MVKGLVPRIRVSALQPLMLVGGLVAAVLLAGPALGANDFEQWLNGLKQEALAAGVSEGTVDRALGRAQRIPRVTRHEATAFVECLGAPDTESLLGIHADGRIVRVRAERPREVDGAFVATPWVGSFRDWQDVGGLMVPMEGEVLVRLVTRLRLPGARSFLISSARM